MSVEAPAFKATVPASGKPHHSLDKGAVLVVKLSLILTYANFAILLNSVGTVILQVIRTFSIAPTEAAILEAFKDVSIAVVSFAVASFLPRLGYRRALILGLAFVMIVCAGMPLFHAFWAAKLLFAVVGVSFALVKTATYATIGLLTSTRREHASLTNVIEGMFMMGVLGGYWLFAAFIDPADPRSLGWLDVYWILLIVCVVNIALLLVSSFDESAIPHDAGPLTELKLMPSLMLRLPMVIFFLATFLYVFIEQGIGSWLPTFNAQVLHLPAAMSVQAASVYAAGLAIGRLGAGALMRRMSWFPILISCIVLMAVLIVIAIPLATGTRPDPNVTWLTAPLACFILPAIGLFLAPIYPTINSVVLSSLPRSHHAAAAGLMIAFAALGGTTGSLITGNLFAIVGGAAAFHLALVPMLLLGVCLFQLSRKVTNK
jgi:MFS transporter, FHS family, glucose/mannose:H+ symporter